MRNNNGKTSDQLLTFFASLFGIKRSRMFKIEMMSIMLDGDDDEVTHGDDVDHKENTTYIEWIVINTQTQLSCLYHILRYQIFKGAKKTPVNV